MLKKFISKIFKQGLSTLIDKKKIEKKEEEEFFKQITQPKPRRQDLHHHKEDKEGKGHHNRSPSHSKKISKGGGKNHKKDNSPYQSKKKFKDWKNAKNTTGVQLQNKLHPHPYSIEGGRKSKNYPKPLESFNRNQTQFEKTSLSLSKNQHIESVFNSEKQFSKMGLIPLLSDCLTTHNFIHPSKAQEQAIPVILSKKNLICSSETGSGKTLAFIIPILERFLKQEVDQACILTPTREISIQIESVLKPLAETIGVSTGLAIGGMDMLVQKKILREYPQILIATPGRLVDVSTQGWVWLNYTNIVVLDEVDRMLDMGFEKEISTLFDLFSPKAQILMFTATMNKELEKLSQNYVKDYEMVTIGETMKTKASIDHLFISLPAKDRYTTLKSLLQRKNQQKILIFFNSIDETIQIFRQLKKDRLNKLNCLHSRKNQGERNQVMTAFRSDRINHLLTTDVLARGIDIPNIDAVINYELPRDSEDYIHRIGRTGRADFLGKALSFVNKRDEIKLKKIKQLIKSDQGFNFIGINDLKYF